MLKYERLGIVMSPRQDQLGTFARFNPGVVRVGDTVHMLYRATDSAIQDKGNYISSIGYAKLDLDGELLFDSNEKVIFPTLPKESMGCEDPRIIPFEGRYYIFYTAYDGRVARVGIAVTDDFITYGKLGIISHHAWDKDAFIFPERINGKIAYIHRVEPDIQLDYFDSFDEMLSENAWKDYHQRVSRSVILRRQFEWEGEKVGGSAPPIKTEQGWLLTYHARGTDAVYRSSMALLDLENPSRVLARIPYPMLEPVEDYELYGDVDNVVFPEGAYIHNNDLYLYYGAADKFIALARVGVDDLLAELKKYPVS